MGKEGRFSVGEDRIPVDRTESTVAHSVSCLFTIGISFFSATRISARQSL